MASTRREDIIDTAMDVFNERGTRSVTTHHIAEAMGISPGNLYYYFSSKEAIVLAIYERAIAEYNEFWREAAAVTPDPLTMLCMLDAIFAHQWKYRCLQREFPVLVREYEGVAELYREMQQRRVSFYRYVCSQWIESGYLNPMSSQELDDLVTATWLVGESWLGYLEAMGRGTDEIEAQRGARLVYTLLRPYLAEPTIRLIEASWAS